MRTLTAVFGCFACLTLSSLAPVVSAQEGVDFEKDIRPIFAESCASCHGEEKGFGRLRLHTPEAITEAMGVHNDLVMKDNVDGSELYARLVLPKDSPKRMPKGADPLSEEKIALIKKWIEQGAPLSGSGETMPPAVDPAAPAKPQAPAVKPTVEPASAEAITAVEKLGALVMPLYAKSPELRISFPSNADQVTDEVVAQLEPLASQTVELNLGGAKITDASAESLAKFQRLERLHLEKTEVGDKVVMAIASLPYLEYLNLHSSKVTDAALLHLASSPNLKKLFVWQTKVSYEAAKALEKAKNDVSVNLGWDHPGVVRERLTQELEQVEARRAEAEKAATEAKKSLETAEATHKEAAERAAAIKKELEALDQPADKDKKEGSEEGADVEKREA